MTTAKEDRLSESSERTRMMLAYRNPELVSRFARKFDITHPQAKELFLDLKRFLAVCVSSTETLAPPPQIDRAWHELILFTEEYAKFCAMHAGQFIHHRPETGHSRVPSKALPRTRELAQQLFGELSANWGDERPPSVHETCTQGCGSLCNG